jgi:hypothetical protein
MLILTAMVLVCHTAAAEVFKCTNQSGKTVYQPKPCQTEGKERLLDIKADPVKEAAGKAKLEALRSEQDAKKASRLQAEKSMEGGKE